MIRFDVLLRNDATLLVKLSNGVRSHCFLLFCWSSDCCACMFWLDPCDRFDVERRGPWLWDSNLHRSETCDLCQAMFTGVQVVGRSPESPGRYSLDAGIRPWRETRAGGQIAAADVTGAAPGLTQSGTICGAAQPAENPLHRGNFWWSLAPVAENVKSGVPRTHQLPKVL